MQIKGSRGLLYRKPFLNLTTTALIWSAWSDLLLTIIFQNTKSRDLYELRSNLTLSTKRNDFTEPEGVKYRTFNDQLKNKCNSADDCSWAKLKLKTVLNQLASFC